MSRKVFEFKVVIAGPFGVGKTTMIENVSNVPVVGTEVPTTGDEALQKESTTVGLEYGRYTVETEDYEINLMLYGTPGQRRFRFMWESVSVGADGIVVLVDATTPETWDEADEAITWFTDRFGPACIVGANRSSEGDQAFADLSVWLEGRGGLLAVPCQVTDEQSSRDVVVALLAQLIELAESHSVDLEPAR